MNKGLGRFSTFVVGFPASPRDWFHWRGRGSFLKRHCIYTVLHSWAIGPGSIRRTIGSLEDGDLQSHHMVLPLRHTNRRVFCDITSILVTLTILRTLWWSYSSVHWDGCSDNIDESIWVGIFGISNDLQFNKIEMSISSKKQRTLVFFSLSLTLSVLKLGDVSYND